MSEPFRHEALLYSGDNEFLAGTVPFAREGIDTGEPVMVAVDKRKIDLMTAELGEGAEQVRFVEMANLGRNPGRIIPAWRAFVHDHGGASRPLRGIGEPVWPGRDADELVECRHHESLLNLTFADSPSFTLLCPYDAGALGPEALETAWCTHPTVQAHGELRRSGAYMEPGAAPGPFAGALPPVPTGAREYFFTREYLRDLREIVLHRAEGAGLPERRAQDLVLAVNELATNTAVYAEGHGLLRLWVEDQTFFCEVSDRGTIRDPLAGRGRLDPTCAVGRGLYIVNQVCDLVQIRSGADGTVVRLRMTLN